MKKNLQFREILEQKISKRDYFSLSFPFQSESSRLQCQLHGILGDHRPNYPWSLVFLFKGPYISGLFRTVYFTIYSNFTLMPMISVNLRSNKYKNRKKWFFQQILLTTRWHHFEIFYHPGFPVLTGPNSFWNSFGNT